MSALEQVPSLDALNELSIPTLLSLLTRPGYQSAAHLQAITTVINEKTRVAELNIQHLTTLAQAAQSRQQDPDLPPGSTDPNPPNPFAHAQVHATGDPHTPPPILRLDANSLRELP